MVPAVSNIKLTLLAFNVRNTLDRKIDNNPSGKSLRVIGTKQAIARIVISSLARPNLWSCG